MAVEIEALTRGDLVRVERWLNDHRSRVLGDLARVAKKAQNASEVNNVYRAGGAIALLDDLTRDIQRALQEDSHGPDRPTGTDRA